MCYCQGGNYSVILFFRNSMNELEARIQQLNEKSDVEHKLERDNVSSSYVIMKQVIT